MPYLGRPVTNAGQFEIIDDISSGFDGSETSFTLQVGGTDIQPDAANVTIVLDGVVQIPSSAYAVTASTLNFSEAPTSGTEFHGVLAGQSQFIESDFIVDSMIKSTANISGSKINTDFSAQTVKAAIFDGMISSSAQLADDISGSFSKEHLGAKVANVVTSSAQLAADISGSFSKEHLGAKVANVVTSSAQIAADISGSFGNQRVGTSDSPTFAGGTVTGDFAVGGTLTAQEIHTEFESASILFTSGSTQFGNSSDDVHDFKGNKISGSITSTGSFGSIETKGTGVTTFNGGNVGVGTTAPTVQLEVFGSSDQQIRIDSTANRAQLQFDGKKTSDAEFAEINFANDGDSVAAIHAMRDGENDAARLAFFTQANGGSVTQRMNISANGNVSINNNLDVDGTTNLDVVDIDGAVTQDGGDFIINEAGANYDFRVESDGNTHALVMDGAQGFIGIGASQPGYVNGNDHRGGNTQTTSGAGGLLHLEGLVPRIILDDTGDTPQFAIEAQDYFSILELNDSNTSEVTRFRMAKSTGYIGIGGITSPAEPLHVSGSDNGIRIQARSGTRGTLSFYTAGGTLEGKISTNGNGDLRIGGGSTANDDIIIENDGTVNFAGSIHLASAKGIGFSATSDATGMSSELLDDYEEGVYDITIGGLGGGSIGLDSSKQALSYTKIGRQVTVQGEISVTSVSSLSGTMTINLPFSVGSTIGDLSSRANGTFSSQNHNFNDFGKTIHSHTYEGQSVMYFVYHKDNGTWEYVNTNTLASNTEFRVSLTYFTN